jgi:voltage-dependent calcium channel
VARTETNKLVTDLVNLDRVRSLLRAITCRRRYLAHREKVMHEHRSGIPSIVVDADSEIPSSQFTTPDGSPRPSISSPGLDRRFFGPDVSLALDSAANLQRSGHGRRPSDMSMLSSSDYGSHSRRSSSVEPNPQNVLSSAQASIWGSK